MDILPEKFIEKIIVNDDGLPDNLPKSFTDRTIIDDNLCWLWTGKPNSYGYGRIILEGVAWSVHRLTWTLLRGPIPPKLQIDHYRMNKGERHAPCSKLCTNPDHLEVVTLQENVRRGPAVENAARAAKARTHCKCGLPLSGNNIRIEACSGVRRCVACRNHSERARYARRREKQKLNIKENNA